MTTTAAIIAAGEARAALVATMPRTQLIMVVDMDDTQINSVCTNLRDNVHNKPIWVENFGWHP